MAELEGSRDLRILSRSFSMTSEYGDSWTKLERYLFIEIYNVIKEFYTDVSSDNIVSSLSDSIALTLPVDKISESFFSKNQKRRDLLVAAEGLSKKQISFTNLEDDGQYAFDFISMFPRITYNPSKDAKNLYIQIHSEVYEKMVPIESYCQLDLRLISDFNSGNTIRLYEVFKSYSFRGGVALEFTKLRKLMGFAKEDVYPEWKYFNAKVLKPAVAEINKRKEYDIEVLYSKGRGSSIIEFTIITHVKESNAAIPVLSLNDPIDRTRRKCNMVQRKYISSLIVKCKKHVEITNEQELNEWIMTDLIIQQEKHGGDFDFKYSMNAISMQIRDGSYSKPYSHKYLANNTPAAFNQEVYNDIKLLDLDGDVEGIKNKYSDEQITANQFGHLLS